jgi:hypothetical protein
MSFNLSLRNECTKSSLRQRSVHFDKASATYDIDAMVSSAGQPFYADWIVAPYCNWVSYCIDVPIIFKQKKNIAWFGVRLVISWDLCRHYAGRRGQY